MLRSTKNLKSGRDWNILEEETVTATSLESFKTHYDACNTVDPRYNVNFGMSEKLTLYEILRYIED